MELDSPWLIEEDGSLLVNGVDVVPLVDAEWSLAQTLRHLVMAIDTRLGRAILEEPVYSTTVRSCLHTILTEEWEHLRYATRDLAVLTAAVDATQAESRGDRRRP